MTLAELLGIVAGCFVFGAYIVYGLQIYYSASTPNPATWLTWLAVSVINAMSYFTVVHGRWYQSLVALTVAACVSVLFIFALLRGRFSPITTADRLCTIACGMLATVWIVTRNARMANLAVQAVYILSYIPTLRGIRKGTVIEAPLAWVLAAIAHLATTSAVLIEFSGDWLALVYPIVTGVFANVAIASLAFKHRNTAAQPWWTQGRRRMEIT